MKAILRRILRFLTRRSRRMRIRIDGNPGTGNTFQNFYISHVENLMPAASSVTNHYYGPPDAKPRSQVTIGPPAVGHDVLRQQILDYVGSLIYQVDDGYKSRYRCMWEDILDLSVVSASVYNPGKQQGTCFNRNLVANIIPYLAGRGVYGDKNDYNAAQFAMFLQGDKNHAVRAALGSDPEPEIVSRLNRYFEI